MSATQRNARRTLQGVVIGDSMNKTVAVQVERRYKHAKYGKFLRKHTKYLVHDEEEKASTGDLVEIAETRPMSKRKRWRLVQVLQEVDVPTPTAAESGQGDLAGTDLSAGGDA